MNQQLEKVSAFYLAHLAGVFIFLNAVPFDTLEAPADMLFLSQLIMLGDHSAIHGRCASL